MTRKSASNYFLINQHVIQPYLTHRPSRLHGLAESITWNRFLSSLNVCKFGLWKNQQIISIHNPHPSFHLPCVKVCGRVKRGYEKSTSLAWKWRCGEGRSLQCRTVHDIMSNNGASKVQNLWIVRREILQCLGAQMHQRFLGHWFSRSLMKTLKGPKREIFGFGIFAQIRPIWIG